MQGRKWMKMDDNEKYENLANAIIERAVEDYIVKVLALNKLLDNKLGWISKFAENEAKRKNPQFYTSTELQAIYQRKVLGVKVEIEDIERFFHSDWYGTLTKVDGQALLKGVKQKIKDEHGINVDELQPKYTLCN